MWVLFLVSEKMESAYIRSISYHILFTRIFTDRQQPMSQEQGFLPAVIKGKIKEKGEHDMLFISALELVQTCQKHGILIRTDCVIHFCDEQGTWHEMTHAGMAMELMQMQNAEETRKLLRELSRAGIPFYLKG